MIDKFLPHAWRIAVAQSEGAAKADDAVIPTYIWDTTMPSVYPMFTPSCLTIFCSVLLGYRSKQMYTEFCTYMLDKYNIGSFGAKNNRGVGLLKMEITHTFDSF